MGINKNYDVLFAAQGQETLGEIQTLDTLVAGTLYVAGTYEDVPLTGGSGTGATADITVDVSGNVTVVTKVLGGTGYEVNDTLSADNADLGGIGSGFSIDVATIDVIDDFVSIPFLLNNVKSEYRKPMLRMHGDLDSGEAILQTLNPGLSLAVIDEEDPQFVDNSFASTDWQDTDDEIAEQMLLPLQFSNLTYRLKLKNLGAAATQSAEIIYNAE